MKVADLKNNCAIMDTKKMKLTLRFKGEVHVVDLTEGDLEDNWNTITMADGTMYDFNLYWEEEGMKAPLLSMYGLLPPNDVYEYWHTNTDDQYPIHIHRFKRVKKEYFLN